MGSKWVGPVALTQLVCEQTRRSPEPEAGHGHTLLGLCVQRPCNQNLGDGLGRPWNKQVSAVDSVQAWTWEWPLSLEQALLSPEEEEASEVKQLKKIPKRRD